MVKKADIPGHVIDTAMKLAAERGWRDLSLAEIADAAKLPLSKVYPVFPSKTAILGAFSRQIDAAVLEGADLEAGEAGAREGGAETFFVSLVWALQRAGLDQLVVIRRNLTRSMALRQGGVEPVELPFGRWFDFHTVPGLRRQARIYRPQVVMTWLNRASGAFPRGDFLRLARLGGFYDRKYYRRCDHLIGIPPGLVEHIVSQGWPRARAPYLPNFAAVGAATRVRAATPLTPPPRNSAMAGVPRSSINTP